MLYNLPTCTVHIHSTLTTLSLDNQNFAITRGEDLLTTYTDAETASGVPVNRFFCKHCGSNVYMRSTDWHDDDSVRSETESGGAKMRGRVIVLQVGGIDEAAASLASQDWGMSIR